MEINIKFTPEQPKRPKRGFSASEIRQKIIKNKNLFDTLMKMGYNEEEASRKVIENG